MVNLSLSRVAPLIHIDSSFFQIFEFVLGSHLHITEKASDESIQLNGTYPDDYQFEQEMILSETVVQTRRGMLVASR